VQREECFAGVTRRLREILARKLMENVQFTVDVVDDLPVNPAGSTAYVYA
jgi:hypothetical protein